MDYQGIEEGAQKTSEAYGYFFMLLCQFCFAGLNLAIRDVTTREGLTVANMIFVRSLTHVLFCLIASLVFLDPRKVFYVPRKHIPLFICRALLATGCLVLSYQALYLVPLAVISSVYLLDPIVTILLAFALIGERISPKEAAGSVVSIFGVLLVANPNFLLPWQLPASYRAGIGLELISTFLAGCTIVSVRALAQCRIHYMMNTFAFGLPSLIMGIALGGANLPTNNSNRGLLLAFLGSISGFFAHTFMAISLQYCRASTGALIGNVSLPIAFILGVTFLGETSQLVSLAGAVLVMAGCAIIGLVAMEKEKSSPSQNIV